MFPFNCSLWIVFLAPNMNMVTCTKRPQHWISRHHFSRTKASKESSKTADDIGALKIIYTAKVTATSWYLKGHMIRNKVSSLKSPNLDLYSSYLNCSLAVFYPFARAFRTFRWQNVGQISGDSIVNLLSQFINVDVILQQLKLFVPDLSLLHCISY